ncbi:uncharacterized protein LOC109714586 [Ananas comosus]|uniref:Uncharacterized protein LOC109714586 n=2 Tax=Ananas comosus TaxID=4615 RepID=A0A199UJM0_ANACO|nr:uncharacterized protein LOC109714586 [Ananas comosus]OAY65087.1 hypothetical protein ACMD2_14429 [Ananas comosus]
MQRQSIGSPSSKLQINGGGGAASSSSAAAAAEEVKVEKAIRWSSRAERSIHLIPLLTLLCFLVLYLLSHDLSPSEISTAEIGRGDDVAAAMRSQRGLKAVGRVLHRKLGLL